MAESAMQLFPVLEPAIEAALRLSIERFGVIQPITVDQHGRTLDGHNRRRLAQELGVPCPEITRDVADDDEARAIAITLNTDRRHWDAAQRRAIAVELRSQGHSFRAIGGALGVDAKTIRKDTSGGDRSPPADRSVGLDGKSYPSTRPRPAPVDLEPKDVTAVTDDDVTDAEAAAVVEQVQARATELVEQGEPVESLVDEMLEEWVESKRLPIPKPDLGDGLSHPARYSRALYPVFERVLAEHAAGDRVLDPFAGVGGIHELQAVGYQTVGVELEPEYVAMHVDTIQGNALALSFDDGTFDAIVTSPTYGNRMADSYNASDPESRRSYHFDLGRAPSEDSSSVMQWGRAYRDFHRRAWTEAVRVLCPDGVLVLNIKDHVRDWKRQYVAGWHVSALAQLGLTLLEHEEVGTPTLRQGANGQLRYAEMVYVFRKGDYE